MKFSVSFAKLGPKKSTQKPPHTHTCTRVLARLLNLALDSLDHYAAVPASPDRHQFPLATPQPAASCRVLSDCASSSSSSIFSLSPPATLWRFGRNNGPIYRGGTCVRNRINLSRRNYKEPYIRRATPRRCRRMCASERANGLRSCERGDRSCPGRAFFMGTRVCFFLFRRC